MRLIDIGKSKKVKADKSGHKFQGTHNSHINRSLSRPSSLPKLIEFLVNGEAKYVQESFNAEQRGQVAVKSVNFGKAYLPKAVIKRSSKVIKKDQKDSGTKDCEPKLKSTKKRKKEDKKEPLEKKSLEAEDRVFNPITKYMRKNVIKSPNNNNQTESQKYTYTKAIKKPEKVSVDESSTNDLDNKDWIKCYNNSCRYDSFLTVFTLCLYTKDATFDQTKADGRHRFVRVHKTL